MSRICLYYLREPETDRWLPGDRYVRPAIRRVVRGKPRPGGVEKVFINLCLGLDELKVRYEVNLPFQKLHAEDRVGVLGRGRQCLKGYDRPNSIVAGPALMTHPAEWPSLCEDYPVVKYLQHSEWANNVYKPYFGDRCFIWPVGIDMDSWCPRGKPQTVDFLIYDKMMWERKERITNLLEPIQSELKRRSLSFEIIRYGEYTAAHFKNALSRCRAMIFLCEHESQGLAYQEALASGVSILAWDQGWYLDPNRFAWGASDIPATSVPYFDDRCGMKFKNLDEFEPKLDQFIGLLNNGAFLPREYILENLTLKKCAAAYLRILDEAGTGPFVAKHRTV